MQNSDRSSLNEIISLTLLIMMGLALFASPAAIAPVSKVAEQIYDADAGPALVLADYENSFRHEGE